MSVCFVVFRSIHFQPGYFVAKREPDTRVDQGMLATVVNTISVVDTWFINVLIGNCS